MSTQDNSPRSPYGGGAQGYKTEVRFGERPNGQAGGSADMSGQALAAADLVKDTTTAAFSADVIRESRNQPVLVDFWAPWCGPCKQLTPSLEKAVRKARGAVKLVKMNIDEHPTIAGQLGIQSIPAVIAFRDGQPVDGFMGAIPESQVRDFIAKLGGNAAGAGIEEALAAAAEAREQGDAGSAREIYSAVLAEAPDNVEALAGLADLLLEAGEIPPSLKGGLPPTRRTIRRASISPWSRMPSAGARKRPTICSPSSRQTAPGRTTARAPSFCSSSKPGARRTRRRSRRGASSPRFCFPESGRGRVVDGISVSVLR